MEAQGNRSIEALVNRVMKRPLAFAIGCMLLAIGLAGLGEPPLARGQEAVESDAAPGDPEDLLPLELDDDWLQPPPPPVAEEEDAPEGPDDSEFLELPAEDPIREFRELLELYGVGESHMRSLVDGRPLHLDERETLHRLLFNMPRMELIRLESLQQRETTLAEVAAEPDEYRAAILRVMGRVRSIERRSLTPELEERFEYASYYEVEMEAYPDGRPLRVVVRTIPQAWEPFVDAGPVLDEQASALGVFIKVGGESEGGQEMCFVATRIAWHPDRAADAPEVAAHDVLLGNLGMDVGLFDDVVDRASVRGEDRECFYQLLSAMRNGSDERLKQMVPQALAVQELSPLDVKAWREAPASFHGEIYTWRGVCRKAVEVMVKDEDIQQRFGISRYYQLVVFVELDGFIEMTSSDPEEESKFISEYPIVVCVRQLPPGMPQGPDINEPVEVTGVFFKLYAYGSEQYARADNRVQLSPLLVGNMPRWTREERTSNPWVGPLVGGLFAVALLSVWLSLWQYSRGDREFQRDVLSKQFEPPADQSLDDIGLEASSGPDFSHLDS